MAGIQTERQLLGKLASSEQHRKVTPNYQCSRDETQTGLAEARQRNKCGIGQVEITHRFEMELAVDGSVMSNKVALSRTRRGIDGCTES